MIFFFAEVQATIQEETKAAGSQSSSWAIGANRLGDPDSSRRQENAGFLEWV